MVLTDLTRLVNNYSLAWIASLMDTLFIFPPYSPPTSPPTSPHVCAMVRWTIKRYSIGAPKNEKWLRRDKDVLSEYLGNIGCSSMSGEMVH